MNILKTVAIFVRDLLSYDEQLIRIGRQNFEREDFEAAYIVVDALTAHGRVASTEQYNGTTETAAYSDTWRGTVLIDFYGSGAYDRAAEFSGRCRSQTAYDLRRALSIDMYRPSGVTDVAALTGQQYGERYQLEIVVMHTTTTNIDTLRIDTAQLEIRDETGVKYSG